MTEDDEAWVELIRATIRRLQINVLFPVTERGIELVAQHQDLLGGDAAIVPLPSLADFKAAQDKLAFYDRIVTAGLPVVPSQHLSAALPAARDTLHRYPIVIKPRTSGGGRGIQLVKCAKDFLAITQDTAYTEVQDRLLVQPYVAGTDLCVQLLAQEGRITAATIQRSADLAQNHFGPQRVMQFVQDAEALQIARAVVGALRWHGLACIDLRIDLLGKHWILELNPRAGQALLGSLVAGVNLPELAVRAALGETVPEPQYRPTPYAHPQAYLRHLGQRLAGTAAGRPVPLGASGWRFTWSDPLPDLVHLVTRAGRRLRSVVDRRRDGAAVEGRI